jgi:hypothetical protein
VWDANVVNVSAQKHGKNRRTQTFPLTGIST